MRRRLVFAMVLALSVSMLLTSCKGKKAEDKVAEPDSITEEEPETDSDTEETVNQAVADDKASNASGAEYIKAYQDFLKGYNVVWFDAFGDNYTVKAPDWDYEEISNQLKPGKAYTLSEFSEGLSIGCGEYFDIRKSSPKNIGFSYIDCGNDGVPELALLFEEVGNDSQNNNYIAVIKLIDDKLQCVFQNAYAYRTYGFLNEYGFYSYGGSNGASSYSSMYRYINENAESMFLYGIDDMTTVYSFYLRNNDEHVEVAEQEGVAYPIEIERYFYEPYEEDDDYTEFINNCDYVYYPLDDEYMRLEGKEQEDALASGAYDRYWKSTNLPVLTEDEAVKKVDGILADAGVTDIIRGGNDVEWFWLSEYDLEKLLSWTAANEATPLRIENPSWSYYYYGYEPEPTAYTYLEQADKTPNDITDDDLWFEKLEMTMPDRLSFSDNTYSYRLYGEDAAGLSWYPYMMDICEYGTDEAIYTLDMSDYYMPDEIAIGDESFVEESIHWAVEEDGILYVSTYHNTYASSAPHNGYITAFDIENDFRVLWRTEPLTCNSDNFVIKDDAIICGYGFTAEDDYVYVLDKGSGLRVATYKVKTGPDWFVVKNNQLYVRCYDTDYVFDIKSYR